MEPTSRDTRMVLMKPYWCLALVLSSLTNGLSAQNAPILSSGSRVRVAIVDPARRADLPNVVVVGRLESIGNSVIVLQQSNGESVSLPGANARVYLSMGSGYCSARRGRCVLLGALGGAAFGFLVPALLRSVEDKARDVSGKVMKVSIPLGAAVGAAVGAKTGGERWQRVDISSFLSPDRDRGASDRARPRLSLQLRIAH